MQNLQDAGAVVTGAGHGIGRALASRLVAEGARVVVNDLDADACRAVADELGATAAPGDCSSDAGVRALVETATEALGRIDVYLRERRHRPDPARQPPGLRRGLGPDARHQRDGPRPCRARARAGAGSRTGRAGGSWSPRRPPGCSR